MYINNTSITTLARCACVLLLCVYTSSTWRAVDGFFFFLFSHPRRGVCRCAFFLSFFNNSYSSRLLGVLYAPLLLLLLVSCWSPHFTCWIEWYVRFYVRTQWICVYALEFFAMFLDVSLLFCIKPANIIHSMVCARGNICTNDIRNAYVTVPIHVTPRAHTQAKCWKW